MDASPDIHDVQLSDGDRKWCLSLLGAVPGLRAWAESIDPEFFTDLIACGVLLALRRRRRDTG